MGVVALCPTCRDEWPPASGPGSGSASRHMTADNQQSVSAVLAPIDFKVKGNMADYAVHLHCIGGKVLRSRVTYGCAPSLPPAWLRFDFLLVSTAKVMPFGLIICQQSLLLNLLVWSKHSSYLFSIFLFIAFN